MRPLSVVSEALVRYTLRSHMVSELAGYACDQVKLVANAERMLPSRLPASDLQLDALALHTGIIERGFDTDTTREIAGGLAFNSNKPG